MIFVVREARAVRTELVGGTRVGLGAEEVPPWEMGPCAVFAGVTSAVPGS